MRSASRPRLLHIVRLRLWRKLIHYCTDENGILYSKDKKIVYGSYQMITDEEIILPATVEKKMLRRLDLRLSKGLFFPRR